jgi:hypothetical protein
MSNIVFFLPETMFLNKKALEYKLELNNETHLKIFCRKRNVLNFIDFLCSLPADLCWTVFIRGRGNF